MIEPAGRGAAGPDRPGDVGVRGDADRRRYMRAASIGAASAWVVFVLIIGYGRGDLWHRETFGGFYDAQARALLDGRLDVDADAVRFEGFRMGDRTFIYQGLAPAVARLPVEAVTDAFDGRLTGLSMALGFAVGLVYVVRLLWRTRVMVRGPTAVGSAEVVRGGFAAFGLGASTLLFLASKAWIYHEALVWGAALALASLSHLIDWVGACGPPPSSPSSGDPDETTDHRNVPRLRSLLFAGAFALAAIHSRFSLGLGAVAALVLVGVAAGVDVALRSVRPTAAARWRRWAGFAAPDRAAAPLAVLGAAVVLSLGTYAAVNQARFATPFGLPIDKQVLVGFDRQFQRALADNGGSLFGLRYTPSQVWQLVRPDALGLQRPFPFVGFPSSPPAAVGGVVLAERDWASSLPLSEPLLVLVGLGGLVAVILPRRMTGEHGAAGARLPVLGSMVATSGFGLIGYVAFRYQADLWPTLAVLAAVGLHASGVRWGAPRWSATVLTAAVAALALWGGWVNGALALEYQRVIAPGAWDGSRAGWLQLQSRVGPVPPVRRIAADAPLPTAGPVGQVLAVGDCAALYRSNGELWYLLEGGPATGSFAGDLQVTGPVTTPQVLLAGQGPAGRTEVTVEPAGVGRVRFSVVSGPVPVSGEPGRPDRGSGAARAAGPTVRLRAGERLALRTEADWRTGFTQVRDGDRELLSVTSALAAVPELAPRRAAGVDGWLLPTDRPVCRSLGG